MSRSEETCAAASNTSTFPEHAPVQRTPEPSSQACSRTLAEGSSEKARSTPEGTGTHSYSKPKAPWVELNTAWASARGQLITALQVSASAPSARLREVQVSMDAAAKDGARSQAWETRGQQLPSRGKAPTRGLPATRTGSASLSSTPRPWTRHSASGLYRLGHAFNTNSQKK
jgi:hypothetical protein